MLLLYSADLANRAYAYRYNIIPWTDERLTQLVDSKCKGRISEYLQARREIFGNKDLGEKILEN